jgi:outer membrane protein assembly factor BamB
VIDGDLVYVMGAFGNLACLELKTGKSVWEIDLWIEFEPEDQPKWGACSTPLLIDGKLIVNPGAKSASLAALDAKNGKVLWKTPGRAAGYGSLILAEFGGKKQIVGHDADSLNGWDPATGKNLWRLVPPQPNDFNVPTPIVWKDKLIVITENNKTRVFEFHKDGTINPKPIAVNTRLAPDTHSPVVVGNKLLGAWRRLYCLDLTKNLKPMYDNDDEVFQKYCAIVATEERALAISMRSELLLFDVTQDEFTLISKTRILPKEEGVYSHPAFVGKRMYLRGSSTVVAIDLE